MLAILTLASAVALSHQSDPVVYSFAFFGCNRLEKDQWEKPTNPSSANLPQLQQNFQDIAGIRPVPNALFATGDLVLGYEDDKGEGLNAQLEGWIAEFRRSPLRGKVALIPIAGNHEMNRKVDRAKLASDFTSGVWNQWLLRNHLMPTKPNGPGRRGADGIVDDQSRLNFSIEHGPLHFTIINTDTRVSSNKIGAVPMEWIRRDISEATSRGKTVFMFGHRNLTEPLTSHGDSPIDPEHAGPLVELFKETPLAKAYVCAHVHAWDVSRIEGSEAWQIVGGNGGTPLEKDWKPASGRSFGFGVVSLHKSGQLTLTPYQRPEEGALEPAVAAKEIELGSVRTTAQ
ncbi:MAG: metallophosphoesterase [Fimbriimonadaceae bacterium]